MVEPLATGNIVLVEDNEGKIRARMAGSDPRTMARQAAATGKYRRVALGHVYEVPHDVDYQPRDPADVE